MVVTDCLFHLEILKFGRGGNGTLHGVNRDRCGQEATLYGVNKDLSVARRHNMWGQ